MKDEAVRPVPAESRPFASAASEMVACLTVYSSEPQHPAPCTLHPAATLRYCQVYGERSDRHQEIMMMDADALHEAHPFTEALIFNEARHQGHLSHAACHADEAQHASYILTRGC